MPKISVVTAPELDAAVTTATGPNSSLDTRLDTVEADLATAKNTLAAATDAATASVLVKRDSAGRAKFADGSAATDVATKGQLDTAIATRVATSLVGAASGVATLDSGGKVPQSQLPAIALTEYLGAVASQTAMLALSGQRGDWTTRTDRGTDWQLIAEPSSTLANWREMTYPASPVTSVDGRTGAVTLGTTTATANELVRRLSDGRVKGATATADDDLVTLLQQTTAITAGNSQTATTARQEPVSRSVTAAITLALADTFDMVQVTPADGATVAVTVPTNATVAFPVGSWIDVVNASVGYGIVNLAPASGVTVLGPFFIPAGYNSVRLLKTGTDTWVVLNVNHASMTPTVSNVPLLGGWSQYGAGFHPLRAIRFGHIVFVQGLVKPDNTYASAANIATLPVGFRPAASTMIRTDLGIASGPGDVQMRTDVLSSGVIQAIPQASIGAGTHHWVNGWFFVN